jgi:protein SCO1
MIPGLFNSSFMHSKIKLSFAAVLFLSSVVQAYDTTNPTKYDIQKEQAKMDDVGLDFSKKGSVLDLNLQFTNEAGETKALGSYFTTGKPVLLSMVYYMCPSLCSLHMNGLTAALKELELKAGTDFQWIAISMDSKETYNLAADKKESYIEAFEKKDEARKGWNFLVGDDTNIKELTQQLGFSYKWDDETKQFAHSSAVYVLTSEGKISQIITGVDFDPKTLKLSLIEASQGQVGSFLDRALMMCFQFNPQKNKFTIYAYNIMKIGALLTLFLLGVFLLPSWLKVFKS